VAFTDYASFPKLEEKELKETIYRYSSSANFSIGSPVGKGASLIIE